MSAEIDANKRQKILKWEVTVVADQAVTLLLLLVLPIRSSAVVHLPFALQEFALRLWIALHAL